jgi:hypothetical protein
MRWVGHVLHMVNMRTACKRLGSPKRRDDLGILIREMMILKCVLKILCDTVDCIDLADD